MCAGQADNKSPVGKWNKKISSQTGKTEEYDKLNKRRPVVGCSSIVTVCESQAGVFRQFTS